MAALIEVADGHAARETGNQNQAGWEVSGEVIRPIFNNSADPRIAEWAKQTVEMAGGDASKVRIAACVPVENVTERELNKTIAEAMQKQLIDLGVADKNISIVIGPLDFRMLDSFMGSEFMKQNWTRVQKRLTYATDEDGAYLLASAKLDKEVVHALLGAKNLEEFSDALKKLGDNFVFFPEMTSDKVVTWVYDEMRKATVRQEQEKLKAKEELPTPKEIDREVGASLAAQPLLVEEKPLPPRAPPRAKLQDPRHPPILLDVSIDYHGGAPISANPPGSIYSPPMTIGTGENVMDMVNTAYNLNHVLGAFEPLWNPQQPQKAVEAIQTKQFSALFGDIYFDEMKHIPSSYASRVVKELFDIGAQIKIGKLEEGNKLYIFSSIPFLPIRGTLPLMDGVAFSIYQTTFVGAAWTKDWLLTKSDNSELIAQTDIRAGILLSERSLLGAPSYSGGEPVYSQTQKMPAIGLKLMDGYKTTDVISDNMPIAMLDAHLIYKRDITGKTTVQGTLTLSGMEAVVSGGWPALLFEGECNMKDIINTSFMAMNGGARVGLNAATMRFEEISAYLTLEPKNKNLPALSIGASKTYPLKGDVNNIFIDLEKSFELSPYSSIDAYARAGATFYPYDWKGVGHATNFEFGIRWSGVLDIAPRE